MAIYTIDRETSEDREQTATQDEAVPENGQLQENFPVVFRDCGSDI
jgi:hypothetical protein